MSKAETFGLTIAEGMACGTPGVVYDNTAHPELISYDTGMIVETSNISAFKNAIEKICCQNKAFYKKTCRKRAEERFDKNICFDQYLKLYEQVLAE